MISRFVFSVIITGLAGVMLPAKGFAQNYQESAQDYQGSVEAKKTKFEQLWPLAMQGDSRAQFELAKMYSIGEGVRQNDEVAALWYRRAAEGGHTDAQTALGLLYFSNNGVPLDHTAAYMWANVAADLGNKTAELHRKSYNVLMSSENVSRGKEFSQQCHRSKYKGCYLGLNSDQQLKK
jgi:TPR repeat protein